MFMARVAQDRAMDAHQLEPQAHLTIATLVLPIGWQAGALPRRIGAAGTPARVALQQRADAREHWGCQKFFLELVCRCDDGFCNAGTFHAIFRLARPFRPDQ